MKTKPKVRYKDGYRITEYWSYSWLIGWYKVGQIKEPAWYNPHFTFENNIDCYLRGQ